MYRLKPFSTFVFLSIIQSCHVALGVFVDLPIVNRVIQPDGYQRSAVLAGGTFPGPMITGFKGDNFLINVQDQLTDTSMETATSVHWHGIVQNGTNWSDGTSSITQCPIVSNDSFLYNFSVPDQAGTFWYHSHFSTQYCDGLRGPLIVYDPNDPHADLYDVDDESTIITLADWYHTPAPEAGPLPFANSYLINGLGRYTGGPASPLSVINVVYGKRYRMRLMSLACHPNFLFTIDGHNFTIIEADGENTEPLEVDSLMMYAGQRYSLILEAKQPINNYWVRAQPNQGNTTFLGGLNSAILRYVGAKIADPTSMQSVSVIPFVETNLHPLSNPAAPGIPQNGAADISLFLNVTFDLPTLTYYINGATFVPPSMPVLLQILSGARKATDILPPGTVITLPRNKVVDVTIPGGGLTSPHPYHLHGHPFSVVRSAGSDVYNYENPVRRDVVNAGSNPTDNMTFRFVTDNPGPWFMHCHLDWHLAAGLAVVFAEDPEDTASHSPVPEYWDNLCPAYNASTNGTSTTSSAVNLATLVPSSIIPSSVITSSISAPTYYASLYNASRVQ